VLRWETLALDVGPIGDLGELPNLFKASLQETIDRGQDRLLAVRVELQGQSPLHRKFRVEREHILQSCQSVATGLSIDGVWIEKVLCNTRMPNESDQQSDASQDAIRAVMEVFQDAKTNPDFYKQIQFDMSAVRSKIPSELRTAELDGYLGGSEILLEQAQERLLDLLGSEFSQSDSARAESMKSDLGETR
jgi:hypothetical protein